MTTTRVKAVTAVPRSERDILKAPQRKGFTRRLVINDPIRIEEMEELGYRLVKKGEGTDEPLTRREFVVMETPDDQFAAREAAKVAEVKAQREAMTRTARRELEAQAGSAAFRGKTGIIGGVTIEGGS